MESTQLVYRKNFSLIIAFLILISVTLIVALIISYNLTTKYVENEFASKKINVLEQTTKPYNDFSQNKIQEITNYQGFLDSASAAKYAASVFADYPFVERIVFYDIAIGNSESTLKSAKLGISVRAIYSYTYKHGNLKGQMRLDEESVNDFKPMAGKLSNYIAVADTSRAPTQDEQFKTFYDIKPEKISYLNIPRPAEIKTYRELQRTGEQSAFYKQNMMTFFLDPHRLVVKNTNRELYQNIAIQPVVYDPIDNDNTRVVTDELALPGALSDYKLYFRSDRNYLNSEINSRFMPTAAIVLLIYFFLVLIGWLIYRNLSINVKLFKLQYDFINNFTHEFKTPVSVIKIAGSNLKGDGPLTDRQRQHYGKILDEEAEKLNDLMNKLLSFTQIENRSIKIKPVEIKIEEFISNYIDTFRIKYPDFNLSYKINSPDHFYTDPVFLGSIFQNLMENSYKYSHPENKDLVITVSSEKKNIVFTFADKGIGIPKSELVNVFKKFYRIENKYNQNGSVGLGLAFCKELVTFMNGQIMVKSKQNEGSVFIVTLPYEN